MRFTVSSGTPTVLWTNSYGTVDNNSFNKGVITADGGYGFSGITTRLGDPLNDEAFIAKINSDGSNSFMRSIGTTSASEDQEAYSVTELPDGTFAVSGLNNNAVGTCFYMMKVADGGFNCSTVQDNGGVKNLSAPVFTSNGSVSSFYVFTLTDRTGSIVSNTGGVITGGCGSLVILPIELLSLSGYNNGQVNILEWSTATETNNDYFTIEGSSDAVSWIEIGKVKGAGNSTSTLNYFLTDEKPFNPITYYRLKQTDFDGQSTTSDILSIRNNKNITNNGYYVFPNPTTSEFSVLTNSEFQTETTIEVINYLGQTILKKIVPAETNEIKISLDNEFSKGIYFIILKHDREILYTNRIIKQ